MYVIKNITSDSIVIHGFTIASGVNNIEDQDFLWLANTDEFISSVKESNIQFKLGDSYLSYPQSLDTIFEILKVLSAANAIKVDAEQIRVKKVNSQLSYYCIGKSGALTSEPKWQIYRIYTSGDETITEWANNDKKFDKICDNAESYFSSIIAQNTYSTLFDGLNDYGNGGGAVANYDRSTSWSISLWVRPQNFSQQYTIINKLDSNVAAINGYRIMINTTGKISVQIRTTTNPYGAYEFNTTLTALQFNHVVLTYNGGSNVNGMKIYINGTLDTYTPPSGALTGQMMSSPPQDFKMGVYGGIYFSGHLDEVSTWNRELSASEVTEIYNSGSPTDISQLLYYNTYCDHWWRMGDGDVFPTIADQKGTGHITLYNASASNFAQVVP